MQIMTYKLWNLQTILPLREATIDNQRWATDEQVKDDLQSAISLILKSQSFRTSNTKHDQQNNVKARSNSKIYRIMFYQALNVGTLTV